MQKKIKKSSSKFAQLLRSPRFLLLALIVFLYTGLFFSAFKIQSLDTANNIDGSWSYALASLRHHPEQSLGNNTYFTYGPLSVKIIGTVYHDDRLRDFLVSISLVTLTYLLCLYLIIHSIRQLNSVDLLIAAGLLCLMLVGEPVVDLLFFATALIGLAGWRQNLPISKQISLLLGLILLSTYKNNLLIAVLGLLFVIAFMNKTVQKKIAALLTLFAVYYAALIVLGISFLNVPKFLIYSVKDALSYNEFMSLTMHQALTITYFIALMVYAFARLAAFYQAKPRKLPWSAYWSDGLAALGEIWLLWIAFKEASTRSDGHVILFLPFMFYMAARLLVVAYPSVKRRTVYYAWVAACFTIMSAIILWTVPPLLHTTKRLYAKSTIKNIAWVEVAHQYDYAYFKQERYSSQQAFSGLVRDVAGLRDSLASYAKGTGIKSPKLVGYTNTIFYLPAITNNYTYAPFLQTYQAFPTTLFDKLYMQYLVSHPQTLVFWSNLNPSIDGRMPSGDLPKTFQYLHDDYSVVASYHGLYVLAKSANPNKIVDASSCKVITINSYTNTPTALASGAKSISVNLHELSRLPIDTLYKKPVYQIFLYNDMGQVQIYRTTPSLLKAGINTDPLLPSLISPSSRVNRIMVSASDEREASLTITQRVCAP